MLLLKCIHDVGFDNAGWNRTHAWMMKEASRLRSTDSTGLMLADMRFDVCPDIKSVRA